MILLVYMMTYLDDDDDNDKNSFKKAKGVKKSCV